MSGKKMNEMVLKSRVINFLICTFKEMNQKNRDTGIFLLYQHKATEHQMPQGE